MTVTAKDRVIEALDYHFTHVSGPALGFGPDPYEPTPRSHPMALALYAHGLVHLYAATGDSRYAQRATGVADRLVSAARRYGSGHAWGLSFAWRGLDANEPFTITTAIAVRALAAVDESLSHTPTQPVLAHEVPWRIGGAAAPWYSPSMPYTLTNVASMVASALHRTAAVTGRVEFVEPADEAARFVVRRQHRDTGLWRYGYAGDTVQGHLRPPNIVDALHMAYTLEGPLDVLDRPGLRSSVRAVRRGIGFVDRELLMAGGRLRERAVVGRSGDSRLTRLLLGNRHLVRRPIDDRTLLVAFPEESRVAGYGAVIGALARASSLGLGGDVPLERLVSRTMLSHASDIAGRFRYLHNDRAIYPRQEAHLFEGLAAYVRAKSTTPGA
jgi:hypothetical protein